MPDPRTQRVSRELFFAAVGETLGVIEPWVTDRLAAIVVEEEVSAGERIFEAGEPPDHFYFIRQGRVELVRAGRGAEVVEGPRAFGMIDALAERPRALSAYARTPLQLMRVRVDAWLELMEDSFELARMSVLGLARTVATLEQQLWATGRQLAPPSPPVLDAGGRPLDVVERLALLMRTPPLRGAGVQPLSDLAMASSELTLSPGERLFTRGVPRDRVFVLIDGRVEASREAPRVSWRGGPGEMVCGVVSFGEKGSDWEAHAVTRTRVLGFGIDDWFDVMEENFEMVRCTLAALARERERLALEL